MEAHNRVAVAVQLPNELWEHVVALPSSLYDLAALCRVNKFFNTITFPHLYRDPFPLTSLEDTENDRRRRRNLCDTLVKYPHLARAVRVYRSCAFDRNPIGGTDFPIHPDSADLLGALCNLTEAHTFLSLYNFIKYCTSPSLNIEILSLHPCGFRTLELETKMFWRWLGAHSNLRHLDIQSTPPINLLRPFAPGTFPRLTSLQAFSNAARMVLPGCNVEYFQGLFPFHDEFWSTEVVFLLGAKITRLDFSFRSQELGSIIPSLIQHSPNVKFLHLCLCEAQVSPNHHTFRSVKTGDTHKNLPFGNWLHFARLHGTTWRISRGRSMGCANCRSSASDRRV